MKIRLYRCQWHYLPYPVQRTFQIGPLFLGRHFPGCSTWSLVISTATTTACFPGCFALGPGMVQVPAFRSILGRWTQISFHLGPCLATLCLSRQAVHAQEEAYSRADVS